jgi:hypothetical protein
MANPKCIEVGERSGIKVEYLKSQNRISIFGWYDTYVGIEGFEMDFDEFCEKLGIKKNTLSESKNKKVKVKYGAY